MLPEFYCDPEGDAMSKSPGHWDRPSAESQDSIMTLKEVAKALRLGRVTTLRLVQTGKLQAFKAGRAWRIRREDLERFMQPQAATKRETAKIPAAVDFGERRRQ
jgi:excisionase family DNA binding protein